MTFNIEVVRAAKPAARGVLARSGVGIGVCEACFHARINAQIMRVMHTIDARSVHNLCEISRERSRELDH